MSTEVRVRFAPSPTGFLHIGSVRTALYNYLYAKKSKGVFVLRIEDTDSDRSKEEYTEKIKEGLNWLGLQWDEGPYHQSQRLDIYRNELKKIIQSGHAYKCFCSPDELKKARKNHHSPAYSCECRNQKEDSKQANKEFAWRFKTPASGTLEFNDLIKGDIKVDCESIEDFVLMRSGGMPTYNFTCAIDDSLLEISHVIRGDDHISNTPKQLLIYKALNRTPPYFAHLPQVHGNDGKRLSKRTGAVSLSDYINAGYIPEALLNYLALLGWSTEDSQQVFTKKDLINKFSLERISSSSGIFDTDKLNWINGKHIRMLDSKEIARRASNWLQESNIIKEKENIPPKVIKAIDIEKDKINLLSDVPERIDFMLSDNIIYNDKAVKKRLKKEGVHSVLSNALNLLENTEPFTAETLEEEIRKFSKEKNLGLGKILHPLRVAVSGKMKGPGLFELLDFIGKEKSIERIKYAIKEYVKNE
ncbi:MAG: glutamate--tRNA ligase [Elusimicrobiota bacterium]